MNVVITGGRDYKHFETVAKVLDTLKQHDIFVGDCPTGVDKAVRQLSICRVFKANWGKHGKAAGPIRNKEMLDAAGSNALVIAFPGGRGTANCIAQAKNLGLVVLRVETKRQRVL